jgi:hypothetical protein
MVAAVGLDLLAPPGSLTPSDRAGLLSLPHPIRSVRQAVAPIGRYREVLRIAAANGLLHRRGDAVRCGRRNAVEIVERCHDAERPLIHGRGKWREINVT